MVTSGALRVYSIEIAWWSAAHLTTRSGTCSGPNMRKVHTEKSRAGESLSRWQKNSSPSCFIPRNQLFVTSNSQRCSNRGRVCCAVFTIVSLPPGYGTSSVGRVCECWKVMRSLFAAFASTTRGLSAGPTTGQSHTLTHTSCYTETRSVSDCCIVSCFCPQQDQGVGPSGGSGPASPRQHVMPAHSSGERD